MQSLHEDKLKFLEEKAPHAKIEVDGGINPQTAKLCKEAGANLFVSASYILGSNNPKRAERNKSTRGNIFKRCQWPSKGMPSM